MSHVHRRGASRRLRIAALCCLIALLLAASHASAFPRTVVDSIGHELHLPAPPQRIFSTGSSIDVLLLSVVDPARVVGVTVFGARESYVADKVQPHMVQVESLSPEHILSVDPDLVLVAEWNDPDVVRQIRELGYAVYTFAGFGGVSDALEHLRRVGEVTGNEAEADAVIAEFNREYEALWARIEGFGRPRVLHWDSWGFTYGAGTNIDSVIRRAGGTNVASEAGVDGWQQIDAEFVIEQNPDVIITDSGAAFVDSLLADGAIAHVEAVRTGRVYHIDHMGALSQYYILAIDQLARRLHPAAFE